MCTLNTLTWPDQREREREMFYLTTHSTHFIYGYMASDMVKDHSDSEKGNPLPLHRLLLSINSKGSFICTIPDRITHTMAFVTPVVEHWLDREIAQWVHPMKDRSDDPLHHEQSLYLWATSRSLMYKDTKSFLSQTEEPTKAGTRTRDRRALQQLALNVHVKHSDLTWPRARR